MLKLSHFTASDQHTTPRLPVTTGWPLLGALPALLRQPIAFLHTARRQYGDIYALRLGPFQPLILNHPDHVQHVLRDNGRNYRALSFNSIRRFGLTPNPLLSRSRFSQCW